MKFVIEISFFLCFLSSIDMQFIQIIPNKRSHLTLKCISPDTKHIKKYEWYFFDGNLINNDNHFAQNENNLILKNVHLQLSLPELKRKYTCGAQYQNGTKLFASIIIQSDKSTIRIKKLKHEHICSSSKSLSKLCRRKRNVVSEQDQLKFSPIPTSKNFELSFSGKIHCKAIGSSEIYWMKNENDKLPNNVQDINGTLHFNSVQFEDRGTYTCYARNDRDSINASIEVRIMPCFEVLPDEQVELIEMQSFLLNCVATGFPKPTIKWNYDGKVVDSNDERFRLFSNGSLLLNEARQEDSGTYSCIIGNSAGLKRKESQIIVKPMDSFSSFESNNKPTSEGFFSKAVLLTCLSSFIYIVLVVALMLWCRKKRMERNVDELENKDEVDDTASDGEEREPLTLTQQQSDKLKKLKPPSHSSSLLVEDYLMLRYDRLLDISQIGNGYYGEVLGAFLLNSDISEVNFKEFQGVNEEMDEIITQKKYRVLAKSLSSKYAEQNYVIEFQRQIELFRSVKSQHVAKLLALSFENDHHYLILEHGQDLKSYLTLTTHDADTMKLLCSHVVRGLKHIAKLNLTHRDIALRNCIIVDNVVKLTMVSLSQDKHASDYFKIKDFVAPLRHLAPEIPRMENFNFTGASDIYACGITIWEILTYGQHIPFQSMDNSEFFEKLQSNALDYKCLLKNFDCKFKEMEDILLKCWSIDPLCRPTAQDLSKFFINLKLD